MAFIHAAFVRTTAVPLTSSASRSWTPRFITPIPTSSRNRPSSNVPKLSLAPRAQSLRRRLIRLTAEQVDAPMPVTTEPKFTRPPFPSTLVKSGRITLAFAARAARRLSRFRQKHAFALKLARMGGLLALAMVSYVVTRGAMNTSTAGIATVSAPALPQFPYTIKLPERVSSFVRPFTQSFGAVFLSEFGDKSMFATALMAMKHNPFLVCLGAFAALTVMTFIACFLGQLMRYLPSTITYYSSIALFAFFGLQMILQSRNLPNTPGSAGGERADAEELVAQAAVAKLQNPLSVLVKVSSLIFVAEWCDRSMVTTMALAAGGNAVAVIGGATLANIVCTGMAVGAATLVANRISEKMVALVAGILFEFFAVFTYLEGPEG